MLSQYILVEMLIHINEGVACGHKKMGEWRFLGVRAQTDDDLWLANLWVCIAHFSAALFVIIDQSDVTVPVTTSYVAWKEINDPGRHGESCRQGKCYLAVEHAVLNVLPDISLAWLLTASHVLSLTWQFTVLFEGPVQRYYHIQRKLGRNPLRWIEYSLSAPLMIVVIAAILGQADVCTLALLGICTSALMAFGYLTEVHYRMRPISGPHVCGWIMFSLLWGVITFAFILGIERATTPPPPPVLAVIYPTYFIMLTFFSSFGVVQAAHLNTDMSSGKNVLIKDKGEHDPLKYNAVEMWYRILSLSSKIALSVILYFLVRTRHRLLNVEFRSV